MNWVGRVRTGESGESRVACARGLSGVGHVVGIVDAHSAGVYMYKRWEGVGGIKKQGGRNRFIYISDLI